MKRIHLCGGRRRRARGRGRRADGPEPKVVAAVNGEKITLEEFDAAWNALPPDMRSNYERSGGRITYLETYIGRKLIVQEAIKNNLAGAPGRDGQLRRAREEVLFDSYIRKHDHAEDRARRGSARATTRGTRASSSSRSE